MNWVPSKEKGSKMSVKEQREFVVGVVSRAYVTLHLEKTEMDGKRDLSFT